MLYRKQNPVSQIKLHEEVHCEYYSKIQKNRYIKVLHRLSTHMLWSSVENTSYLTVKNEVMWNRVPQL